MEKTSKAARSTDRVYLLLRQQEGLVRRGVGSIAIRALGHFYLANLFALPIFLDAYLMAPPAALAG